jgi:hypothetical protein
MGRKIYHPISPEVQDQTGLKLCGRHQDGRYQYRSYSVFHQNNVMSLTHEQRVGLALCYALAKLMRPGTTTAIYPMTKTRSASGWGSYGGATLWLMKSDLFWLGMQYLKGNAPSSFRTRSGRYPGALNTLAHEMGHNTQHYATGRRGRPHGPEFEAAFSKMRVAMQSVLSKGWPKLDMRKLRDSVAPHLAAKVAKKKRKEVAASESRVAKWTRKLAAASRNYERWAAAKEKAERLMVKHQRAVRHAEVFLNRALRDEEEGSDG